MTDQLICPHCGASIENNKEEICPFCGKKLLISRETVPSSLFLENLTAKQKKKPFSTRGSPLKNMNSKKKTSPSQSTSARLSFIKSLQIQKNPEIIPSSLEETQIKTQKSKEVKQFEIKTQRLDPSVAQIKTSAKVTRLQVDEEKIPLGKSGEYIKFIGIISKNRDELFSLNKIFTYLLDLAVNLEYISTSILSGKLDRMLLTSLDKTEKEFCYFSEENELIFVIYGRIPEKKAQWLLSQIKISVKDYLGKKSTDEFSKLEKYELSIKFRKKIKFLLESILELQDVFTEKPLKIESSGLRVDYFGLSYQSIGVISKMITNSLTLEDLPPIPDSQTDDFEDRMELQEAVITAKVEAIAANIYANTLMTPDWISVKLGFQHYRFIFFSRIHDYYISLLADGNLESRHQLFNLLTPILDSITKQPFMGVLTPYSEITPQIFQLLSQHNSDKFDESKENPA